MGNGNKVEFLIAVCALVTSLIAIWVAWDQSRVMRAQQHGMVFPVLQADGFVSTKEDIVSIGVSLENSGVGPALLGSVIASVNGEEISTLESFRPTLPSGFQISWAGVAGRAIAPGNKIDAIRLEWDRAEITQQQLNTAVTEWSQLDLEFCYCSVFERCWVTKMGVSKTNPVKACRLTDTDIFEEFGLQTSMPSTSAQSEASQ